MPCTRWHASLHENKRKESKCDSLDLSDVSLAWCREVVLLEDLCCFLPAVKAQAAFTLFDVDGDGKISLDDMRDAVISIYKERKHLALTLRVWHQHIPCMHA